MYFFMQYVGKCPRHSGSESLPAIAPLQRSYGIVAVSKKYQNVKKSDTASLSQLSAIYKFYRPHVYTDHSMQLTYIVIAFFEVKKSV